MWRTITVPIAATVFCLCVALAAAQENMTPDQKIAQAKKLCEGNHTFSIQYKCDCIVEHFSSELAKNPTQGIANLLHDTTYKYGKKCTNTEAIHANALAQCADQFPITADEAMTRLGRRQYCHCFADKTVTKGKLKALLECKQVTSYAVPANSPLTE